MIISHKYSSPYFGPDEVPIEFLVIHSTSCDLERTISIFNDAKKRVCSHFVLDEDGTVYDLAGLFSEDKKVNQGHFIEGSHAGVSKFRLDGKNYTTFNKISLGIEVVNLNGNLFPFTSKQYKSLSILIQTLQKLFPSLNSSERILGHEHIAGYRGKADPGRNFDWKLLFSDLGLKPEAWHADHSCSADFVSQLKSEIAHVPESARDQEFWINLSLDIERRLSLAK